MLPPFLIVSIGGVTHTYLFAHRGSQCRQVSDSQPAISDSGARLADESTYGTDKIESPEADELVPMLKSLCPDQHNLWR